MRDLYTTTFLCLIILMTGCGESEQQHRAVGDDYQLNKILHGGWLPLDFVRDLPSNKSPYNLRNELATVSEILFDSADIKGEKVEARGGWGNFEGFNANFYVYRDENGHVVLNDKKLGMHINLKSVGPDYILEISDGTFTTSLKKVMSPKAYKSASRKNDLSMVNYYIIRNLLQGKYKSEQDSAVFIMEDGSIEGLDGYTDFSLNTSFLSGDAIHGDVLTMIGDSKEENYLYQFDGNTLVLKEIELENGDGEGGTKFKETGKTITLKRDVPTD
ncbi:hypothetical protein V6R21_16215 [Limibacter armeniacum]|uniref:hypothetical protein n=1 Tax=Limibacter armeniacum TaxID=466084 RepID=UPI002FE614B5